MSADESVLLLHRLSDALQQDGTLAEALADVMAVLEAIAGTIVDDSSSPSARLLDAAIVLGERRRNAGLDAETVIEAYDEMRQAMLHVLRTLPPGHDAVVAALERIDARTTLALRASLVGHARPRLERDGRWADTWQELFEDAERLRTPGMRSARPRSTMDDPSRGRPPRTSATLPHEDRGRDGLPRVHGQ